MIFSILAFIALVLSIGIKNRKKSLGVQSLNCLFEAIYSFIIEAFTGAFLSIVNFIRTFIFMHGEKISKKTYILILILFEGIIVVNCIYTWNGFISLLPTIGSIIRTYCLWQTNMKLVRISGITSGVLYGLYYAYYQSWFIVMGDIILVATSIISIYRYDKRKKKINILVTRHGQTDWNLEGRIQGRTDVPLNQNGMEQVYQTSQKLRNEEIDLIICSPLKRCRQTAEIINQNRNIPVLFDERLVEISYGEIEGKLRSEIDKCYEFGNVMNGQLCKEAESSDEFIKRVADFLNNLKNYEKNTILLVTHNEVCKAINIFFNDYPKDNNLGNLGIQNGEVIHYEICD